MPGGRKTLNEQQYNMEKEENPTRDLSKNEIGLLIQQKEKYELIAGYSVNWEGWFDSSRNAVWMNSLCFGLTGFTPEEYLASGDCLAMMFTAKNREKVEKEIFGKTPEDSSHEIDVPILRKDGTQFWAAVSWRRIFDGEGSLQGIRTSIKDTTLRKMTLEALNEEITKYKSVVASKDKFLSIIAHDLRSPISGIIQLTGYMSDEFNTIPEKEIHQYSQSINRSANHALELLVELLEWEKAELGLIEFHPQLFHLKTIVNEVVTRFNELTRERSLNLVNTIPDELHCLGDKNMVKTVLRNLVSNAHKFTPAGGTISLGAKIQSRNLIQVTVMDTGIGMSEEQMAALFHFDSRNQRNGLNMEQPNGLGLLLCREFISKHDGKIWAESVEKMGSSIHFTLPSHHSTADPVDFTNGIYKERNGKKVNYPKILIVEDDKISLALISRILQKISREIIHAESGVEAIEQCRNNPELNLVLMDIGMPGMSGYEAARQIRRFNRDVIIIAQSAGYSPQEAGHSEEVLFNDYINKPIDFQQLFELIRKHSQMQK